MFGVMRQSLLRANCFQFQEIASEVIVLGAHSLSGLASELSHFAFDVVTQNFQKGKIGSQLTKPVFPLEFPLSLPFDTAFILLLP